jgi:hypothetical protein
MEANKDDSTHSEWLLSFLADCDVIRQKTEGIDPSGPRSNRGKEWYIFSAIVAGHIENYTVPQYGDAPDDQASGFSEQDIAANMRRYVNRLESGVRGPVEAQRDLLKIAHYCALLYFKREKA